MESERERVDPEEIPAVRETLWQTVSEEFCVILRRFSS